MDANVNPMYRVAVQIANGLAGHFFCYCIEEGSFYIYKLGVWEQIHDLELLRIISEQYPDINNNNISIVEHIPRQLKRLVYKRLVDFNSNGYLNFDIGEYDTSTYKIIDHSRDYYSTIRIPYPFDNAASCPLWIQTLNQILEGNKEKIEILQEFFGYCLTRDTRQRKALLLLGDSNCGKSTILNILRFLVGEMNCSSVPLKKLPNPQHTPMLINKLINIDSEVSMNAQEFEDEFKIITSGEPINCNQKFIKSFEFVPYCKLAMAANIFPRITDHSSAFYNRLILIPCEKIFKEKEQDKKISDKLKNELSGIFNWSIEGLKRLRERGTFERKEFMMEAVKDLEDNNNPVNRFLEDHVVVDLENDIFIIKNDLYDNYRKWSISEGHGVLSSVRFGQSLYKKFNKFTEKRSQHYHTGKRVWKNLKYVESKGENSETNDKGQVKWED